MALTTNRLVGFGSGTQNFSGANILEADHIADYNNSTIATTHTYSGSNIGAADSDRYVVVTVCSSSADIGCNVDIGGQAGTLAVEYNNPTFDHWTAIYYRKVTAGTTATIAVNSNDANTMSDSSISIHRIVVASGMTLSVHDTDNGGGAGADNWFVNVLGGGIVLASAICQWDTGTNPILGQNLTVEYQWDAGTVRYGHGHAYFQQLATEKPYGLYQASYTNFSTAVASFIAS